ncbi:MAG: hypothetical protein P4L36_08390 [Holophaga sp.]|nr:hypothetical protein [Holophaga sp.]
MSQPIDAWQEYRHRRRVLFLALLAGVALFGGGLHLARTRHSAKPFYVGLALLVGMTAWGSTPLVEFPCPKCGEPFSYRGRSRNLFTRKCMNCQHPKWAPAVSAKEAGTTGEAG